MTWRSPQPLKGNRHNIKTQAKPAGDFCRDRVINLAPDLATQWSPTVPMSAMGRERPLAPSRKPGVMSGHFTSDAKTQFARRLTLAPTYVLVLFMSTHDTPDDDFALGWTEDDVRLLDELANLGMGLARAIGADPSSKSLEQKLRAAAAFAGVARAVRFTLALKALARGGAASGDPGATRGLRIIFRDDAEAEDDEDRIEREPAERGERGPRREIESERIYVRSPADLVDRICRDLEVPPAWRGALALPGGLAALATPDTAEPGADSPGVAPLLTGFVRRWALAPAPRKASAFRPRPRAAPD